MKNTIKTLLVAATAGLALVACTTSNAQEPPAGSSAVTTTTAPTTSTSSVQPPTSTVHVTETQTKVVDSTPVLDGTGYGNVKLGMSIDAAKKSGLFALEPAGQAQAPGCVSGTIKGTDIHVFLSAEQGLSSIFLGAKTKTAAGIGVGSTLAEVIAAYPDLKRGANLYTANASPKAVYSFVIGSGKVMDAGVFLHGQNCHN